MQKNIVVLGMGGTIAGTGSPGGGALGYQAGQVPAQTLMQGIPIPEGYGVCVQQVAQLDSKDMDDAHWWALAQACAHHLAQPEVAALVITHGTDTLEETAWFLQCVLPLGKPVVLTCAMRPVTALSPDGPANLRDALVCAAAALSWASAQSRPVLVVASGEVHTAQWVRKAHPYRVHAFSSGDLGPLGWVEEGRVRWAYAPLDAAFVPTGLPMLSVKNMPAPPWPWVEVVTSHAGVRPEALECLLAAGVQGMVVAGTGNGTVHASWLPVLQRARAAGVRVWRCTRCPQGQVVQPPGQEDAEVTSLLAHKARISLMLQLLVQQHHVWTNGGGLGVGPQ